MSASHTHSVVALPEPRAVPETGLTPGESDVSLQLAIADLERLSAEERALGGVLRAALSQMSMKDYLEHAVDVLLDSVPWLELLPGGGVFLAEDNGLRLVAQQRLHPALQKLCARIAPGQCLCGLAAQTRQVQHAACVDGRHSVSFEGMGPHGHYNVPILRGEILLGVLVLYLPHGRARDEREVEFLHRVADALAMGIHNRQVMERQIEQLTQFDVLTGLANRDQLEARVSEALLAPEAAEQYGALICLDIDRFAVINRSLGHAGGDRILEQVAEALRHHVERRVPQDSLLARAAGGEFMLWLPALARSGHNARKMAGNLAQFLIDRVAELRGVAHGQVVTMSAGIALAGKSERDTLRLIKQASMAMHHAKDGNRSSIAFYDEQIREQAEARILIERDLRAALDDNQLLLYYQPQTNVDGALLGAEALIRWNHPQRGMVSPGEFIPVAEESEMIVQIGVWTLQEACRQIREWRAAALPVAPVSVNVSAIEFHRQDFAHKVGQAIADSGIPPELITLELTESMVMSDAERVVERMHALREIGVRIALDDFGTGYSSLTYLKDFPLHEMKIDQSFVRGLPDDIADVAIVESVVALANRFGFEIVVEGVETEAQRDFLASLNCTRYQGYLFSRPVPAAEFADGWLR